MDRKGRKGSWSVVWGLFLMASIAISGCSGGGGGGGTTTEADSGGTGSALKVAEKVSVVDADTISSSVAPLKMGKFRVAPPGAAATSAWNQDQIQYWVAERSTEAFDIVNEILCAMAQSKYDEKVNLGNYKALIDMSQCSSDSDSAESAGQSSQNQSSSSDMPDYETWTVNSYRADSSSSHMVKVWIHEEGNEWEPAKIISVKATITEAASATNPYGIFTMNFKAVPESAPSSGTAMFKGYLQAVRENGTVLLKFVCSGGFDGNGDGTNDFGFSEQVVLNRTSSASGSGSMAVSDVWEGQSKAFSYNIAFNDANFLRKDRSSGAEVCLDRVTFDESAWRYGLYDSTGARVNRESGFPIKYTSGGQNYHGWVGYWGLWLPNDVTIADGATVYKQTYGSGGGTETPYTVYKRAGKLKKYTRSKLTLDDIYNIPLDYWEQVCTNQQDPSTCTQTGYRVKWNASNFVKFQTQTQGSYMWTDMSTPTNIDITTLNFGELNFWSQSLGGQVRVKLNCTWNNTTMKNSCGYLDLNSNSDVTDDQTVIFFKENIVYPSDTVPSTLKCFDNCPKYTASAGGVSTSDPYYQSDWSPIAASNFSSSGHDYTFSDMLLKEGGNALTMGSSSNTYQWGIWSGALFDPSGNTTDKDGNTISIATALQCDWNTSQICGWKAWGALDTYYSWESGPEEWNQFTGLKDSTNTFLEFQQPLQVAYTYQQSGNATADAKYYNSATPASSTKFYLEYSGFGDLHGIPGVCIDMDTGDPVSCSEGTRWVAEFMIPVGATVTASNGGSVTYYVKPLEIEQRMKDDPTCSLSSSNLVSYTLPDITLWEDPAIGTEPTITGAPAVIGGVVQ